jgi:hypothetical protein
MVQPGYCGSKQLAGEKHHIRRRIVGALLGMVLLGLLAGPAVAHAQSMDPASAVAAFIAGENAHDVAGVTALFTSDASVSLATGPLQGTDQIRAWQQELADGHFAIEVTSPVNVSGSKADYTVTIALDSFRQLGLASLAGTEDMVLTNGKISSFTFAFTPEAAAMLQDAIARAGAAPGMPTTGDPASQSDLWALLLGGLTICAAGWAVRRRTAYQG